MNIHENHAKKILKDYSVPVSNGFVIFHPNEIKNSLIRSRRFNPRARDIPISVDLAAARRTKTRKIKSKPTIMEKDPKIVKIDVMLCPIVSANLIPFAFDSAIFSLLS